MKDIALKDTLDLLIQNGDLTFVEDLDCDFQDLNLLLNINLGDNKQYPLMGTNMIYYKNGVLEDLLGNLQKQFIYTNLPVNRIQNTDDNRLKINLNGNYTFVAL
jgi:hypothetical protein